MTSMATARMFRFRLITLKQSKSILIATVYTGFTVLYDYYFIICGGLPILKEILPWKLHAFLYNADKHVALKVRKQET
jgi:hypothetical protein